MIEKWCPIIGYDDLYQISSHGRVKSIKSDRILKPLIVKNGGNGNYVSKYFALKINLYKDGKQNQHRIHRLVATAFCYNDSPLTKDIVNHIDEDTTNNHHTNLEWCDTAYNVKYSIDRRKSL